MSAVNVKTKQKLRQRFEEKDSRGKSIRESRHVCTCKNKLHSVHAEKCHLYRHLAEHRWPDSDFESLIFILFVWMPFCSLCAFAAVWKGIVSFHWIWSEYYEYMCLFWIQQSESGLYHLIEFGASIMGICVRFEFMPTCAWSEGRKAGGIGKWKKRQIIV